MRRGRPTIFIKTRDQFKRFGVVTKNDHLTTFIVNQDESKQHGEAIRLELRMSFLYERVSFNWCGGSTRLWLLCTSIAPQEEYKSFGVVSSSEPPYHFTYKRVPFKRRGEAILSDVRTKNTSLVDVFSLPGVDEWVNNASFNI